MHAVEPWSAGYVAPRSLETERVHLEPLAPEHTSLDYAALMGSREHLRRTLQWGSWPRPDMTLDDNRRDLERHYQLFQENKQYSYTVQDRTRAKCVGCIYFDPPENQVANPTAQLAYWVIESELAAGLDRHLLESTLAWVRRDWPFTTVVVPVHGSNTRGIALARDLGLDELAPSEEYGKHGYRAFAWHR
ncbi:MAG: GNAT family protein [Planctomycetota bacterium]